MKAHTTRVLVVVALVAGVVTLAWHAASPRGTGGFGPSGAQTEREERADAAEPRVAPKYADVATANALALDVIRTRMDSGDPAEQNWEVALELVRADPVSADADEVFAAWMTGRGGFDELTTTGLRVARSVDGARTFAPVPVEIPPVARHIPFDPTVAFDRIGRRAYIAAAGQDISMSRRLWVAGSVGNDSAAFVPGGLLPEPPAGQFHDKVWLAAGPRPGNAAQGVLYAFDRTGVIASIDQGTTWSTAVRPQRLSNLVQPVVFPDGTLAVAYYGTGNQPLFASSVDEGRSFSAPVPIHAYVGSPAEVLSAGAIAGAHRVPPTTVIARSPVDGRIHAVLHDVTQRSGANADVDVLLVESADGGATWSAPRNLTAGAPPYTDQYMPWIAIDASGRLHAAWLDGSRSTTDDAATDALVDVQYAMSTDHGASWTTTRLTDDPIPTARTRWSPLSVASGGQFVGDYFTLVVSGRAAYVAHPVFEAQTIGMAVSRVAIAGGIVPIRDPRGLTGPWFDRDASGQGIELHWLAGDRLLVFFYGHHDNGANFFLVGTRDGRFGYDEALEIPLVETTGGRYNNYDPAQVRVSPWGRVDLRFASCAAATATLTGPDGVKTLDLERLAVAPGLPCD